ncbi:hypothetical protein DDT46_13670 [Mycobacteroides abscessus]|uniref:hypothetical protein n=1 Tax=Mycobacteroides abscessus TaxID=36809 RepID=UPI000C256983|nr:hypothetical protein [Mycobacteroides abscessus]AWG64740.1 hypothetical protein DDT46_13670 [Mycobacteroides abscessus]RIS83578.1 hypothetical protein D2E44_10490 [Mycobacteroides abscessus]
MRRDQLEHAIRAACQIIGHGEVIVVGSQSVLGTFDENQLPAAATMSQEVDILRDRGQARLASDRSLRLKRIHICRQQDCSVPALRRIDSQKVAELHQIDAVPYSKCSDFQPVVNAQ